MDTDESGVLSGTWAELQHLAREDWQLSRVESVAVVTIRLDDVRSEVWRVAQFIAYHQFVSIECISIDPLEYRIESRSSAGLSFRVMVRAWHGR